MEIHEDGSDSHLLPGYRFCPMEEELILSYLYPKVKGEEVPGEEYLIFNSDLYGKNDPWEIWNMYKERRKNDLRFSQDLYFFTQRKKRTVNGSRKGRTVGSGTWKAVSSDDVSAGGTVVGHRSRFSYENKESVEHGRWIMLEYELERSQVSMLNQQDVHKYVLCKLRKNKGSKEKGKRVDEDDQEKLATGDDMPDDFPALEEYKNVKQEESEIKQGVEDQGMHADGDDVCDAGPSLSSELQEAENCWKQYLNPIIFVDDDNLVPPYADALQWEESNITRFGE
uniref:NAC domain-containing protein 48-like n=1 Tax=Fragaria vesca subsp. vesca TaxID=101020 RepID=UPI0005CAA0CF|nr:PREDICTED: NAC domain-containing protein 48-like [Fragaria vesca subsp. vesca]